jgi:hypothetical protein
MASAAKATKEEKLIIRELLMAGTSIEDAKGRFPHVDGRVISGIFRKFVQQGPSPAAPPGTPPAPPFPPSIDLPPRGGSMPDHPPLTPNPPASNLAAPAQPASQQVAAPPVSGEGFTPQQGTTVQGMSGQGLKPAHREYFIVKKIDPPDEGVMKTEYPPFGINELLDRYPPGDYEVQHYLDQRHWRTYRDKVSPRGANTVTQPRVEQVVNPAVNPAQTFMQAIDIYHRMHTEGKREAENVQAALLHQQTAKENAKAQVEATATSGLLEVVKESMKPKPEPPRDDSGKLAMDRALTMMQEERRASEARHNQDMERMREQAKLDLEKERERLKAEETRFKADLEHRAKMQNDFMVRMQELDKERQALWKESYEKMTGEIGQMNQSMTEQWDEKKKFLDELDGQRRKHFDEVMELRKLSNGGDKDIEVAKIIKDGVVGGLDRIGTRIDSAIEHGVIQGANKANGPKKPMDVNKTADQANLQHSKADGKGEPRVAMKDLVEDALKSEWFMDLKKEIFFTVQKRIKVEGQENVDAKIKKMTKPHGSILAQSFIDQMNDDPTLRRFIGYLTTREWTQVYADIEKSFAVEDEKAVFGHAEATTWWNEFSTFLLASWNQSIGITT